MANEAGSRIVDHERYEPVASGPGSPILHTLTTGKWIASEVLRDAEYTLGATISAAVCSMSAACSHKIIIYSGWNWNYEFFKRWQIFGFCEGFLVFAARSHQHRNEGNHGGCADSAETEEPKLGTFAIGSLNEPKFGSMLFHKCIKQTSSNLDCKLLPLWCGDIHCLAPNEVLRSQFLRLVRVHESPAASYQATRNKAPESKVAHIAHEIHAGAVDQLTVDMNDRFRGSWRTSDSNQASACPSTQFRQHSVQNIKACESDIARGMTECKRWARQMRRARPFSANKSQRINDNTHNHCLRRPHKWVAGNSSMDVFLQSERARDFRFGSIYSHTMTALLVTTLSLTI